MAFSQSTAVLVSFFLFFFLNTKLSFSFSRSLGWAHAAVFMPV
uniref:Uncharacterized protein n=1 Tax=Anguilla anguilla TaxID=7936 RepID=A0A0E9XTJ2_ANGAN